MDGLERRLRDEKKSQSPKNESGSGGDQESPNSDTKPKRPLLDTVVVLEDSAVYSPTPIRSARLSGRRKHELTHLSEPSPPGIQPDVLLDTYFTGCHGKPYHILEETTIRQRIQLDQIPQYLLFALYAVSSRWVLRISREDNS